MSDKILFMQEAIVEARKAYSKKEVPVGAVIVVDNEIVGRGHNLIETDSAIAHAELNAIVDVEKKIGDIRQKGATIFVTCEPCIMCAGAIILSRFSKLFFGVRNEKFGGVLSIANLLDNSRVNHKVAYEEGVLKDEISDMMKEFFKEIRATK